MTTGCPASVGDCWGHDYTQPPHNTPDDPRDAITDALCQAQSADREPWCQHTREYEIVLYQIGTHDWIRLYACTPCAEAIQRRHATWGPRRSTGVASVKEVPQ